jgi:hypothetical protein
VVQNLRFRNLFSIFFKFFAIQHAIFNIIWTVVG